MKFKEDNLIWKKYKLNNKFNKNKFYLQISKFINKMIR